MTNRPAGTSAQVSFVPRNGGGVAEDVTLRREAYGGDEGGEDALDGCGSEVALAALNPTPESLNSEPATLHS